MKNWLIVGSVITTFDPVIQDTDGEKGLLNFLIHITHFFLITDVKHVVIILNTSFTFTV